MAKFGLKVWYRGPPDQDLDDLIKTIVLPATSWAQGYDFGEDVRDIAFDLETEAVRDSVMDSVRNIKGIHAESRDA